MKIVVLSSILMLSVATSAFAAQPSPACTAKRAAIEAQIAQAELNGRSHEVAGLKKALAANQAHCSDAALTRERAAKIREAHKKVAAREKSLADAERKGDAKKIADRQTKLDEARSALADAEKPIGQ